jgi:hypothetical protein
MMASMQPKTVQQTARTAARTGPQSSAIVSMKAAMRCDLIDIKASPQSSPLFAESNGGVIMFARLLGTLAFGSAALMLTQAAAQQLQQQRRFSAPSAPAAAPRIAAPPHISAPRPVARPPYVAIQPHMPAQRTPRIAAPPVTHHVTRPHGPAIPPHAPALNAHPRPPELQQTARLNRTQVRKLRREESRQVRQLQAQQRQHLLDLRAQGQRPDRDTLRQLRTRNAQQLRDLRTQFGERRLGLLAPIGTPRPGGKPRITPEYARQGHFASHFPHQPRPGRWRSERNETQLAWRHRHRAAFVAWRGPVFWPYVYTDLFYYPFWPKAYDDAYWAYAYDDFFDSVYWAEGNPYGDYSYGGPASQTRDTVARTRRSGSVSTIDQCETGGVTAWPFEQIERVLSPTAQQQKLLDELKAAAAQASSELKSSCPKTAVSTPTGRLQAMLGRIQSTLAAVHGVRPALTTFYDSLSDEQKARFNALGPNVGEKSQGSPAAPEGRNACAGQKSGLTELPIERIEDAVHPTEAQQAALDRLGRANDEAITVLQAACPDSIPQTPVARLDAIEKRLDAMIRAAKIIGPALQEFYGSLTDKQKSLFDSLGQQAKH